MPISALKKNVFADLEAEAWPLLYHGQLTFEDRVIGGTPSDPNVAESWLKARLAEAGEDQIKAMVEQIMAERDVTKAEALAEAQTIKLLKGFKKDENGLYIDGRCLKACLKEAVAVAGAAAKIETRKYGMNNAGAKSFVAEHIMVVEQRLYLMRNGGHIQQPDDVQQRFVRTFRGSGITYEEYCQSTEGNEVYLDFTIKADWEQDFTPKWWGLVWLTANLQGFGATRSQSFGRFIITEWDRSQRAAVKGRTPGDAAAKKPVKKAAGKKATALPMSEADHPEVDIAALKPEDDLVDA